MTNGSVAEIPTLRTISTQRSDDVCGIHSIAISPEKQFVATGGSNPNELGVYRLPEWEPLAVGVVSLVVQLLLWPSKMVKTFTRSSFVNS